MTSALSRVVGVWIRELAIAYAAGLVVGAPMAMAVVWLTGRRTLVTPVIVVGMVGVLVWRRRAPSAVATVKQRCPAM